MNSISFDGLNEEKAEKLRQISHYRCFTRSEAVFREGDAYKGPCLVAEGQFKIYMIGDSGKETIMNIFRAGDMIASGPLFLGGLLYPASCSALGDGCLVMFEYDRLKKMLVSDDAISGYFLNKSMKLIPRLKEKIENLALRNAEARICAYLESLGATKGPIALDIPKNQIAALLDLTPESVSRVFNQLATKQLLVTDGKTYRLQL